MAFVVQNEFSKILKVFFFFFKEVVLKIRDLNDMPLTL